MAGVEKRLSDDTEAAVWNHIAHEARKSCARDAPRAVRQTFFGAMGIHLFGVVVGVVYVLAAQGGRVFHPSGFLIDGAFM